MRIPEHGVSNTIWNIAFWLVLPLLVNFVFGCLLFGVVCFLEHYR